MSWLVFLYYPAACLLAGGLGGLALWGSGNLHALSLRVSRWLLLLFPFLLLASCLAKRIGPPFWSRVAGPMAGRNVVFLVLFVLIFLRWLAEVTAWRAFLEMEQGPGMAREGTPELKVQFDQLLEASGRPWWQRLLPSPRLQISKEAVLAHLSDGINPRVNLEAGIVPLHDREESWWWEAVPDYGESSEGIKAVLAHEVGHFRHGDHLRKLILTLSAALLPWEWFIEDLSLGKYQATSTWFFRQWSALMRWIGTPVRAWIHQDYLIKERLADEEAARLVPAAALHLARIRSLYSDAPGKDPKPFPGRLPAPLRQAALWLCVTALFWAAPGRIPLMFSFGSAMETTNLPRSWCLVAAPGSEASAVFLPGKAEPGTIVVKCPKISQGQPSLLRGMGRIPPDSLPGECDIEMDWDVLYEGQGELSGKEAFLSVTQSSMTVRTNPDPFTAYSLPREMGNDGLPAGWRRYASITKVRNKPDLEHMLIGFNLSAPGQYIFRPPTLKLVLPSGEKKAFTMG
jgi:hypothetical protein